MGQLNSLSADWIARVDDRMAIAASIRIAGTDEEAADFPDDFVCERRGI
jgi:hypothetical protein